MTLFSMDARVKPAHDESKVHSAAPLALFGRGARQILDLATKTDFT
jgi:hypothetical protein